MNVLEELWYGNLEPSEFDSSSQQGLQGTAAFGWPQQGKTPDNHDGGAERIILQICGLCPGISRPGGMPAVSE